MATLLELNGEEGFCVISGYQLILLSSFTFEIYLNFLLLFIAISLQDCDSVPQHSLLLSPCTRDTIYIENKMFYFLCMLLI